MKKLMMGPSTRQRATAMLAFSLLGVALLAGTGCSSTKNATKHPAHESKKALKPAKLVKFKASVKVDELWSVDLGEGEGRLGLEQAPAVDAGHVYAAAADGSVYALDLASGKTIWRYKPAKRRAPVDKAQLEALKHAPSDRKETKAEKLQRKFDYKIDKERSKKKFPWQFSGGPGAGDGLVVVGTLDGDVIALNAADGSEKWKAQVHNEVISAPVIGQGYVIVRSNDGNTTAFDASSGERRWLQTRDLPSLTVRGNSSLTLGPGLLFSGNDDGTMSAMSLTDGHQLWEMTVAEPEGRSELDRMADVDAAPVLDGVTLFASSYKKQTIAIDGPSGRQMWTRDDGGVGGVGVSPGAVTVADRDGVVWSLDRGTGSALWSNSTMVRRTLTAPTVQGDYAVVGDYKGYVHWLKLEDGSVAARERVGGKPLRAKPVLAGDTLLVESSNGKLAAFKLMP